MEGVDGRRPLSLLGTWARVALGRVDARALQMARQLLIREQMHGRVVLSAARVGKFLAS